VVKAAPGINTQDATTAKQVSQYFAEGLSTTDAAKRKEVYAALQKYIITHGVAFPIYERVQVSGISSKVHGFAWTSESFLRANDIWKSA
jgi:peptide/nickel transport system substrate-binding protein